MMNDDKAFLCDCRATGLIRVIER